MAGGPDAKDGKCFDKNGREDRTSPFYAEVREAPEAAGGTSLNCKTISGSVPFGFGS